MSSIADRLATLRRLSSQERWLLVQAWLLLLTADCALRLLPFATVLRCSRSRNAPRVQNSTEASPSAPRLAWLVETAGRFCPAGTSCLKEALVLSWIMTRRGMPATLRIGVGHHGGRFTAHAWLEQDGRIILGERDRGAYVPLFSVSQ